MKPVVYALVAVLALVAIAAAGVEYAGLASFFGTIFPYVALATFLGGFAYRVFWWAKSPVPFRIPTTCGQQKSLPWIKHDRLDNPFTTTELLGRMALEIFAFRSLFRNSTAQVVEGTTKRLRPPPEPLSKPKDEEDEGKGHPYRDGKQDKEGEEQPAADEPQKGPRVVYGSTKWLWLAGLAFHYTFLVVLIRHLRFFTEPVPAPINMLANVDGFLEVGVPAFYATGVILVLALLFLFLRRVASPQLRYLSLLNDYFPLFLILGIGTTGLLLRHWVRADVVGVKELAIGLITFAPAVPDNLHYLFYVHLFLVCVLFAYFPFSKLMHAPGVFLSPTRNLANNNRAKRHVNPWAKPAKVYPYTAYEDEFRMKMFKAKIPLDKEPTEEELAPKKKPAAKKPAAKKPKDEKPKDEKPKDEKPKDEKPKDEKPKDEKPKDEKPKDEKPKDEKPKDDESKDAKPAKEDE